MGRAGSENIKNKSPGRVRPGRGYLFFLTDAVFLPGPDQFTDQCNPQIAFCKLFFCKKCVHICKCITANGGIICFFIHKKHPFLSEQYQ